MEQLKGRGKVVVGEQPIAKVTYSITVTQEWIDTSSFEGRSRVPGMKTMTGQLHIDEGPIDLGMATEWTLVLQDGRRCRCVLRNMSLPVGSYTFAVSGEIA